jgi:hypothetical protein
VARSDAIHRVYQERRMTKRTKRNLMLLLGCVGLALLVGAANWYLFSYRPLQRQLRLWEEEGGVTSLRQMVGERPPDAENAAVIYEAAFVDLPPKWDLDDTERSKLEDPLNAADIAEVLDQYVDPLTQVREATQRGVCYWSTDYDAGIGTLLPHVGPARTAAKLLVADAVARSRGGDAAGALESLCQALVLAEHVGSEPFVITQLVQIDYEMRALKVLETLFSAEALPESRRLEALLRERDHRERLQVTLRAELAAVMTAIESGTFDEFLELLDPERPGNPIDLVLSRLLRRRDLALLIEFERERVAHYTQPLYAQTGNDPWPNPPAWAVLTDSVPSFYGRVNTRVAEADARLAMARSALQLRETRRQTGVYPESFDAPTDPYTGQPLQYEKTASGFVLRSAGTDQDGAPLEWRWQ